jgi:hypothetical protein
MKRREEESNDEADCWTAISKEGIKGNGCKVSVALCELRNPQVPQGGAVNAVPGMLPRVHPRFPFKVSNGAIASTMPVACCKMHGCMEEKEDKW